MSLPVQVVVRCMKCQMTYEASLWRSINTQIPKLVESFLNGTLNVATCPGCGKSLFIPIPLLYNDMRHGLMIQIDETNPPEPSLSAAKSDSGIEGVRYRRRLNRATQMITVPRFEPARVAIHRLDSAATVESVRQSHPEWPSSVVYAEAFLCHYKHGLDES